MDALCFQLLKTEKICRALHHVKVGDPRQRDGGVVVGQEERGGALHAGGAGAALHARQRMGAPRDARVREGLEHEGRAAVVAPAREEDHHARAGPRERRVRLRRHHGGVADQKEIRVPHAGAATNDGNHFLVKSGEARHRDVHLPRSLLPRISSFRKMRPIFLRVTFRRVPP